MDDDDDASRIEAFPRRSPPSKRSSDEDDEEPFCVCAVTGSEDCGKFENRIRWGFEN